MITDLKYAFRMLLKTPGFTIIAAITLALGIGANTAIFSVVDAVLLRPLPFKNPEQLVSLWGYGVQEPEAKYVFSFPDFLEYKSRGQSFSAMATYTRAGAVLFGAETQELEGLAITPEIFDVLGTQPMIGRAYTMDEGKVGAAPVVILTQGIWKRAFNSNPAIVGQQINLSGKSHTVLGVMPSGWKFPVQDERIDYVTPLEPLVASSLPRRGAQFLTVVARMKPGVQFNQANAEVKTIGGQLSQEYPDSNGTRSARLIPMHEDIVGDVRPALLILLGAVAPVLLIACANVANLLLARAATRSREIGIRTALGASRTLIVRQLLAESFLLALVGGFAGLVLAWWGVDVLSALGPKGVPRLAEIRIDLTVCAFTFVIAIVSTLAFGLVPALQVSRPDVSQALQQGAKGSTGGLHSNRVRAALVVSQVSLSLLLLAGAGLLIRSFFNLRGTDPGFNPSRVVVLDLSIPRIRYPEPDQQRLFYDRLVPKLRALPGVEELGGVNPLPFSGNSRASSFNINGQPPPAPGMNGPDASHLTVMPGYFEAMRIPVRNGRTFTDRDNKDAPLTLVVNEAFARTYFPNVNPIGQRITMDAEALEERTVHEIVGVVGDAHHDELSTKPGPEMYVPHAQDPERHTNFTIRTAAENMSGLEAAVRRAVHEIDSEIYVAQLKPMEEFLSAGLAQPRFNMMLLGVFAGVAMLLAAVGIYGVIAYSVTQRTREIGIRMALGAQKADMLQMILRQSLSLVAIGLVLGVLGSLAATRLMKTMLFGVGATDVSTYLLVVGLLSLAAFLASYIPARRAMRVDPMVALRYE